MKLKKIYKYETTLGIEIALSRFFNVRINLIVPNISWGLNLHECDILVLTPSGYATEVEIKISKADLLKDKEKKHGHVNKRIKRLFFAIPEKIDFNFALDNIPARSGLIVVNRRGRCNVIRKAINDNNAAEFTQDDRYQMARLGALRMWPLKKKILKMKYEIDKRRV